MLPSHSPSAATGSKERPNLATVKSRDKPSYTNSVATRSRSSGPPSVRARSEIPNQIYFFDLIRYIKGKEVFATVLDDIKSIINMNEKLKPASLVAMGMDMGMEIQETYSTKQQRKLKEAGINAPDVKWDRRHHDPKYRNKFDVVTAFGYFYPPFPRHIHPDWWYEPFARTMSDLVDQESGVAIITMKENYDFAGVLKIMGYPLSKAGYKFTKIERTKIEYEDGRVEDVILAFRK
jgi:hypothetical protein